MIGSIKLRLLFPSCYILKEGRLIFGGCSLKAHISHMWATGIIVHTKCTCVGQSSRVGCVFLNALGRKALKFPPVSKQKEIQSDWEAMLCTKKDRILSHQLSLKLSSLFSSL